MNFGLCYYCWSHWSGQQSANWICLLSTMPVHRRESASGASIQSWVTRYSIRPSQNPVRRWDVYPQDRYLTLNAIALVLSIWSASEATISRWGTSVLVTITIVNGKSTNLIICSVIWNLELWYIGVMSWNMIVRYVEKFVLVMKFDHLICKVGH